VAFARELGLTGHDSSFEGIDGLHKASILPEGEIRLKLKDVQGIRWMEDGYLLDTGSPHYVRFVEGLDDLDVADVGLEIRHEARFGEGGVNVNFVESGSKGNQIAVRTFERGVEAETFSCGTGVTAACICTYYHRKSDISSYYVQTRGGLLQVSFEAEHHSSFRNIYLCGPALKVYEGEVEIRS